MTDWGRLVEEADKAPVWSGTHTVTTLPGSGVRVAMWWRCWDTARFDIGASAVVARSSSEEEVDEAKEVCGTLVRAAFTELVAPAFGGGGVDWSCEYKTPVGEARRTRSGSGREFWSVTSKLIVRTPVGRDLEPLLNAVNKFAVSLGWDGKG